MQECIQLKVYFTFFMKGQTMGDLIKVNVVFRKFPEGDIIALFINVPGDNNGNILSYQHTGQHGAAHPDLVTDLEAATPEEYKDLQKELETIGYDLNIIDHIKKRLEYLRGEIEAERISYGEIMELESLKDYIEPGDTLLLQWAGVPEFPED